MQDLAQQEPEVGLILAAGLGSRLAAGSGSTAPKPLTLVGGTPLLFRTFRSLHLAGCRRTVVVLGHRGEEIRQRVLDDYSGPMSIDFANNPDFHKKNGLSVLAAAHQLASPFVLVMADHVFSDPAMAQVRGHVPPPNGATLFVDRRIDHVVDLDDATKVRTHGDRIVAIGKTLEDYDCIDTGVFVATFGLIDALEAVRRATGDASLSEGIEHLALEGRARAMEIGEGEWQDVDTPEMLAVAERLLDRTEKPQ